MARVTYDGKYKTGVFDKEESELIWTTLQEYMVKNQCTDEDLCPGLRAAEPVVMEGVMDSNPSTIASRSKPEKKRDIWGELARLLPERKPKTIYHHGTRLLMKARLTEWTPESKEELKVLVAKHGKQWAHVGRLLNKNPDDVKHTYKRMTTARANKGRFTKDEDARLTAAMFKILNINSLNDPIFSSGKKLPDGTWNNVTEQMSGERTPTDYLRRWSALLKIAKRNEILPLQNLSAIHDAQVRENNRITLGNGNSSSSRRDTKEYNKEYDLKAFLKRLSEIPMYIRDKSDINWTKLERELGTSSLSRKWDKLMDHNQHCSDKHFTDAVRALCERHHLDTSGIPHRSTAATRRLHSASNLHLNTAPALSLSLSHQHHAYPSTHTVTLPHGSVPIQPVNPSMTANPDAVSTTTNHAKIISKGLDSESESESSDEEDHMLYNNKKRALAALSQAEQEVLGNVNYKKKRE